ncbi:MAG: diguanylate cyclase [Gemmatimonadales bacterium]
MPLPRRTILHCGSPEHPLPELYRRWAETTGLEVEFSDDPAEIEARILRGRGALLFVVDDPARPEREALLRRLKGDAYTAIVPVTILAGEHDAARVARWYEAGADEVLTPLFAPGEQRARLGALMARTERNVGVHPSTRLPGTIEIEREFRRRIEAAAPFAVCYADLDHFKEFNDRYSYYDGDRVIFVLSRILHDVVRGVVGPDGFVGHIGGDDFIFVVPAAAHAEICAEILHVFEHAGAAAVQRAGPPGRVLLRQGPPRPAPPGAADDALDRRGDECAPELHASGPDQRARDRNEELRQDASRLGLRGGPAPQ